MYFNEANETPYIVASEGTNMKNTTRAAVMERFNTLQREAGRLSAGVPASSKAGRYGMYTYGSGLNILEDCDTKARWWVVGSPSIVSGLQQEYIARD